jgi:hypothetical protein
MSHRDWDCSDVDALESLRADEGGASSQAKERVFRHLMANVGALASIPGGSNVDPGAAPAGSPSPSAAALAKSAGLAGRPLALAVAFALGGGVGAATYATFAAKPPTIVYVDRPSPAAPAVASAIERHDALEGAPSPGVTASGPPASRAVTSGSGRAVAAASLAAQQTLLDEARAAFGRGENEAAMRAIAAHERRYPDSLLAEEREALAIKVLVATGRYDQARTRGARFVEQHPRSLLLPAVRDSLETIP